MFGSCFRTLAVILFQIYLFLNSTLLLSLLLLLLLLMLFKCVLHDILEYTGRQNRPFLNLSSVFVSSAHTQYYRFIFREITNLHSFILATLLLSLLLLFKCVLYDILGYTGHRNCTFLNPSSVFVSFAQQNTWMTILQFYIKRDNNFTLVYTSDIVVVLAVV